MIAIRVDVSMICPFHSHHAGFHNGFDISLSANRSTAGRMVIEIDSKSAEYHCDSLLLNTDMMIIYLSLFYLILGYHIFRTKPN